MIRVTRFLSSSAVLFSLALAGCSFSRANEEQLGTGSGGSTGGDGAVPPIPDAGDGGKITSDAPQTCVTTTPQVASVPPDVLIVLDRSASMNDAIDGTTCRNGCGAQSKWVQMTNALEAYIPTVQSTVNWGLKLFASPAGGLCSVTTGAEVAPAASNAPAIMRAIAGTSAASSTPTTAAEMAAASYLMGLKDSNPKFILLATDGIPTCGTSACAPGVDSGGLPNSCDDANAIAAVKDVHDNLSIPTFVVGIGTATGGGDATLTAMAQAGGYPQAGTPSYYPVESADQLTQVFQTITGMVQSCSFTFSPALDTTTQMISAVTADGTALSAGDYTIIGNNAVQLVGQACTDYMAGTIKNVVVKVACIIG